MSSLRSSDGIVNNRNSNGPYESNGSIELLVDDSQLNNLTI